MYIFIYFLKESYKHVPSASWETLPRRHRGSASSAERRSRPLPATPPNEINASVGKRLVVFIIHIYAFVVDGAITGNISETLK